MFKRRLLAFLGVVAMAMVIALLRLGQLQLVQGEAYAAEAERRLLDGRQLRTYRGDILDRHGRILATDKACFEFRMTYRALLLDACRRRRDQLMAEQGMAPEQADRQVKADLAAAGQYALLSRWAHRTAAREGISEQEAWRALAARVDATLDKAAAVTGTARADIDQRTAAVVARVQRVRRAVGSLTAMEIQSHTVIDVLDENAAVHLRDHANEMIEATVAAGAYRWYPYRDIACHVIGRQGRVTAETLRNDPYTDDPLQEYLPSEHVGVSGVEKLCEPILRGSRGQQEVHVSGAEVRRIPATGGRDVRVTLDIELQRELTLLLRRQPFHGAMVMLDVPTGEILALVSTPTYDLNTYTRDFSALAADEVNLPLMNRAIASGYPPGSTLKPLAALAGLAEGVITPTTAFHCGGATDPRRPRCWSDVGHGNVILSDALMNSCNAYFGRMADALGVDRLTAWFRQFGMGELPGTGLTGEIAGLVPTRKWLWDRHQRPFYPYDARAMAIGQGTLLATPLQVADITATIARDGVRLSPSILADPAEERVRQVLPLPAGATALVRRGMYRAVNDPASQTAYRYAARSGPVMCGKTGTAQTGRAGDNMAWFTGFAPADRPRVAFAIVLEYAGGGGPNCVPLAEEALALCRDLGYLDD